MVASIVSIPKFCIAVLSHAALLLWASVALASSTVGLAPGLELTLPDSLVIDVLESHGQHQGPVIAGAIDGEPGYFVAASKVGTWERNNILWRKLETEIRSRSSDGDFTLGVKGSFTTAMNDAVWFRTYAYESSEQKHVQVYFLLKNERSIYWVTLTMVEGVEVDLVIPIAKALIRRARVTGE